MPLSFYKLFLKGETKMYKVILDSGQSFWDEKTKTNLSLSDKSRVFDDDFIENHDMSNIEYAINVGVLKKVDVNTVVKEETIDGEPEKELDKEYPDYKKVLEEEEENTIEPSQCQATTTSGDQCQNTAKYPEDDPKYCHIHRNLLEEDEETEETEEEIIEE
jgi:hypothetical protein